MDLEAACKKHLGALLQALDEQGVKDISNLRDPLARALAQLYDPVQLQEIVPSFLEAQRQAGLAENTVQAYGWQLRRLVAWLREREIVDVVSVCDIRIISYVVISCQARLCPFCPLQP